MLCFNVSGNHRLPLVFIGKYNKPRAIENIKVQLPVIYRN